MASMTATGQNSRELEAQLVQVCAQLAGMADGAQQQRLCRQWLLAHKSVSAQRLQATLAASALVLASARPGLAQRLNQAAHQAQQLALAEVETARDVVGVQEALRLRWISDLPRWRLLLLQSMDEGARA